MPRIIISGGPGSGKTTLLTALNNNGYAISEEVSRSLIQDLVLNNSTSVPWKDMNGFAKLALQRMIEDYEKSEATATTFFDRGIPDIIAYMKVSGLSINSDYEFALKNYRYKAIVFMAPPWKEIYVNDDERWQTFEESVLLHDELVTTYKSAGYNVVTLPFATVQQRVEFILEYLKIDFGKAQ